MWQYIIGEDHTRTSNLYPAPTDYISISLFDYSIVESVVYFYTYP